MTQYEYEVQGFYSGEWECETAEATRAEALERLKEYRANMPEYSHRIKKVKVERKY